MTIIGPITMTVFAPCNNHKRCITLHDWVVEQILEELREGDNVG
jgi:hypothetical protein